MIRCLGAMLFASLAGAGLSGCHTEPSGQGPDNVVQPGQARPAPIEQAAPI
jgi:hypothetical protein